MSEHSLTLYDLEEGLLATVEQVAQLQAEGNEEDLAAAMNALEVYIKESVAKRDNCGRYLQSLDATSEAISNQIEWLLDKQKHIRKKKESFCNHVLWIMSRMGVKTLEGKIFSFKARQNPMKVVIDDEAKIPGWYMRVPEPAPPPKPTPDKKAIAEDLKDGKEVPGAHLEQETRLVIDQ